MAKLASECGLKKNIVYTKRTGHPSGRSDAQVRAEAPVISRTACAHSVNGTQGLLNTHSVWAS